MIRKNKSSLTVIQDKEEKENTNFKFKGFPYFMVTICVILGIISVELGFMNVYLKRIALGPNSYGIVASTNNNPYSVFSEAPSTAFYNSDNIENQDSTELDVTTTDSNVTTQAESTTSKPQSGAVTYVLNKNSKKIHYSDCTYASNMKEENKLVVKLTYSELKEQYMSQGYVFCSKCGG